MVAILQIMRSHGIALPDETFHILALSFRVLAEHTECHVSVKKWSTVNEGFTLY